MGRGIDDRLDHPEPPGVIGGFLPGFLATHPVSQWTVSPAFGDFMNLEISVIDFFKAAGYYYM